MGRALKTTGIVLGVGALIYLGLVVVSAAMFMDFRRTSLAIAIVAGMGLTCVTLGLVRQTGSEATADSPMSLVAFTLAGYNLEAIRSFLAKKEAARIATPSKRTRKKRRTGTWADVIGSDRPEWGRAPPPG